MSQCESSVCDELDAFLKEHQHSDVRQDTASSTIISGLLFYVPRNQIYFPGVYVLPRVRTLETDEQRSCAQLFIRPDATLSRPIWVGMPTASEKTILLYSTSENKFAERASPFSDLMNEAMQLLVEMQTRSGYTDTICVTIPVEFQFHQPPQMLSNFATPFPRLFIPSRSYSQSVLKEVRLGKAGLELWP